MAIPLLENPPLAPFADLGPYRRQDYAALPGEPRCELIYGRFYANPSPSVTHQIVVMQLLEEPHRLARSVGAVVLTAPLDVHLADHSIIQPDILYILKSRRRIAQEWIEGAPDLLIEVLSPGMYRKDRNEKLQLYAESGVREYWIVDPRDRWIEFLRNDSGQFVVVLPEGGVYHSQALPEISLDILQFWREIGEQLTRLQLEV